MMNSEPPAWKKLIFRFFFPSFNRKYLIRLCLITISAFTFFKYVCVPMHINGKSMEPSYYDGTLNFCWRLKYIFSTPKRGDVVMVRLAGPKLMYLKRVVALPGDTVEFKAGKLILNGNPVEEPYLVYPCDWNIPAVKVEDGYVYVVGDNRNVPQENHQHGRASIKRIEGAPLW